MERRPFCKNDDALLWVGKKRLTGFIVAVNEAGDGPLSYDVECSIKGRPGSAELHRRVSNRCVKLTDFRFADDPKWVAAAVAYTGFPPEEVPRSNNKLPPDQQDML